jgi:heme/copper-type cytochrome/quinol oxidase subunit 1
MIKAIFASTLILGSLIIYIGLLIAAAAFSGAGGTLSRLPVVVWDSFNVFIIISIIMLSGGLILMSVTLFKNRNTGV